MTLSCVQCLLPVSFPPPPLPQPSTPSILPLSFSYTPFTQPTLLVSSLQVLLLAGVCENHAFDSTSPCALASCCVKTCFAATAKRVLLLTFVCVKPCCDATAKRVLLPTPVCLKTMLLRDTHAHTHTQDADRMASLWMPSNDVMCIHPGDEPVLGQQAVARSWRSLFRSGDGRFSSSVIKVLYEVQYNHLRVCLLRHGSVDPLQARRTHIKDAPLFMLRVAWPTSEANESE